MTPENKTKEIFEFCRPANYVAYPYPQVNLTEKYPGYRIIDRNSDLYQMEAFFYTCAILLFYTVTTGAFMVKFIIQSREPWEMTDTDGPPTFANAYLAQLAKLRERERHKRLVERQARQDVKLRVINHLNQISHYATISSGTVGVASENDVHNATGSDCGGHHQHSGRPERKRKSTSVEGGRSGSDGLIDVRPLLSKSYSPSNGYVVSNSSSSSTYQNQDASFADREPPTIITTTTGEYRGEGADSTATLPTGGHRLLLPPLWVPSKWQKQSPGGASSNQSSGTWRCTPSPQLCVPRLSPKSHHHQKRRESMDGGDEGSMI